ncbi:ABC transporter permease [Halobacteriales archaeon QS_4_69_31]|nr:MAG: ABC transporter permease [Halobacteriales archaeon QS_4_69_31]
MNYYLKRGLQALFTLWAVLTITFVLTRWMPGGPVDFLRAQMIAGNVGPASGEVTVQDPAGSEQFDDLARRYVNVVPSAPIHEQYFTWMKATLTGDLGRSISFSKPVEAVVVPAIPWTLFLGTVGIITSFVVRVVIGAVLAYREGSWLDFGGSTALLWIQSVPFFLIGLGLLYVTAYQWGWFPLGGRVNPDATPGINWPYVAGVLNHAALPVFSLAMASFGSGAIAMRANSIQELGKDYLRVAQLRGINLRRVTTLYVARNAILPMYTGMLIQLGYIFSGAILIETIFNYKGLGFYLFRGIQARDYPLMMAVFILITVSIVIAMFVADVTYGWVDPRVKRDSESY